MEPVIENSDMFFQILKYKPNNIQQEIVETPKENKEIELSFLTT